MIGDLSKEANLIKTNFNDIEAMPQDNDKILIEANQVK